MAQNTMFDAKELQPKFQPDEYVSYSSNGICKVISMETKTFDDIQEEMYYKLSPLDDSRSTYYVPVSHAETLLRPLLTKQQIYALIDEMAAIKEEEAEWCDNSRQRREIFHTILHNDDYRQILQMMRSLHQQEEKKRSAGRKLAAADEAAMHAAETRLYQEFGIVLDIPPNQVHHFITARIAAREA